MCCWYQIQNDLIVFAYSDKKQQFSHFKYLICFLGSFIDKSVFMTFANHCILFLLNTTCLKMIVGALY